MTDKTIDNVNFYTEPITEQQRMNQTPINSWGVRPETSSLLDQTHIDNKLHTSSIAAFSQINGLTNNDHPGTLT